MKRSFIVFALVLVLASAFFAGCKKDEKNSDPVTSVGSQISQAFSKAGETVSRNLSEAGEKVKSEAGRASSAISSRVDEMKSNTHLSDDGIIE